MSTAPAVIRPYQPTDERSWLLCRLLSFFDTCYYDDVHTNRTTFDNPSIQLVADLNGEVVGLLDVEIDGPAATIDSIAIHPDHQRTGIASRLLSAAIAELPSSVVSLDAWTREDPSALSWYRQQGFIEEYQYLHVYKNSDGSNHEFTAPSPLFAVMHAYCHADLEHETVLRSRFDRVYVCTQFLRTVSR
jgi:ribosomal protein S18 acetylase RimI-like enzyme